VSTIGTALVGYGYAGRTFHGPLIQACSDLSLRAVVSSDPSKVHADLPGIRVYPDLSAALQDPAIALVVIATPNALHAAQARAALEAGRHVVVDKPFTVSLEEGRALDACAQSRNQLLAVFHNRRWDGDFLTLRALVTSGRAGRIVGFESRFDRFRPLRRARWREQAVAGGGLWFDLGAHLVDQALQLMGRPRRVHGDLAMLRDGAEVDDWAQVTLDYAQPGAPAKVTLSASMLVGGGLPRFALHGTAGSWIKSGLDPQESQLLAGLRPGDADWGLDPQPGQWFAGGPGERVPAQRGSYESFYRGCARAVRGEGPNPVPAVEALDVMAILEAAVRSAREGSWQVPEFTG
jgi:predicted dehydrogenase